MIGCDTKSQNWTCQSTFDQKETCRNFSRQISHTAFSTHFRVMLTLLGLGRVFHPLVVCGEKLRNDKQFFPETL